MTEGGGRGSEFRVTSDLYRGSGFDREEDGM